MTTSGPTPLVDYTPGLSDRHTSCITCLMHSQRDRPRLRSVLADPPLHTHWVTYPPVTHTCMFTPSHVRCVNPLLTGVLSRACVVCSLSWGSTLLSFLVSKHLPTFFLLQVPSHVVHSTRTHESPFPGPRVRTLLDGLSSFFRRHLAGPDPWSLSSPRGLYLQEGRFRSSRVFHRN